ncbi:hypothetical protein F7725_025884 [Dissostichus mawsoni]|uniref:Uncharacterized protein n=1 Tax=Dissostichus mawsoni TaxID=36200 RepID=A0A7J5X6D7_DISMA|nr:hypothetical protein F7725_025884 [Dissostichus mawsoni]
MFHSEAVKSEVVCCCVEEEEEEEEDSCAPMMEDPCWKYPRISGEEEEVSLAEVSPCSFLWKSSSSLRPSCDERWEM